MINPLSHLSEIEIKELMKRYYENENVNVLLNDYNIKCPPSTLFKYFPAIISEEACEYCGEKLNLKCVSKSNTLDNKKWFCPNCKHYPYSDSCKCKKCIDIRVKSFEQEERIKRHNIMLHYKFDESSHLDYNNLEFTQKVFLGTIMRQLLDENLETILPISSSEKVMAPTEKFLYQMIYELIKNQIIVVDPIHSKTDNFVFSDELVPETYYIYEVSYRANLILPSNKNKFIREIIHPNIYDKSMNGEEALKLWKALALEECIEYLIYELEKAKFSFNPGDKTYIVFSELLEHFSVSQIWGIIWRKVADASKLYLQGNVNRNHAANTVIGGCQKYGEYALMNNWDLSRYKRPKDLPQSAVAEFFYNSVLKIGDMGFNIPPTLP